MPLPCSKHPSSLPTCSPLLILSSQTLHWNNLLPLVNLLLKVVLSLLFAMLLISLPCAILRKPSESESHAEAWFLGCEIASNLSLQVGKKVHCKIPHFHWSSHSPMPCSTKNVRYWYILSHFMISSIYLLRQRTFLPRRMPLILHTCISDHITKTSIPYH